MRALHSLMLRFTEDDFDSDQALTIGVDFKTKVLNVDGVNVKLGKLQMKKDYCKRIFNEFFPPAIWDTAGQERFRTLTPSYYR